MNNYIKLTIVAIFSVILAMPVAVQARKVEPEKAKKLAQNFVESKRGPWVKADIRLKHTAKKRKQKHEQEETALYYVFNVNEAQGSGFVIVAGDDAVKAVLGYSDNGNYDENNVPPNFAYWMDFLGEQIAWAQEQGLGYGETYDHEQQNGWAAVSPLIQTQWNQYAPYNNKTPILQGQHTVTGCVATAMAQIMKYWNHPVQGSGSSQAYITNTYKISVPAVHFYDTTYDWQNMQDTYSSSTSSTPQNDAVATLMYHVGVSVKMDYGPSSGAFYNEVISALKNYFEYDGSIRQISRTNANEATWEATLREQINDGMPVFYSGNGSEGGHAFILDGYDNTGKFHFNWGWGGMYDGYFVTTVLNPGTDGAGAGSGTYNQEQEIIINIKPRNAAAPPLIIEHPLNQVAQVGETAQFTVEATPTGGLTYQWQVSTSTIAVADTIVREDFEGSNSFTLVNGSEHNQWIVGAATAYRSNKSAYISNDGSSYAYTTTSPSIVHMYRDVRFPVFEACTLWFYFKGIGKADYDYLTMSLTETSATPTAGSNLATWSSGWTFSGMEYSDWIKMTAAIPKSNSNTTKRLVFTWRNNNSSGTNPPVAVDNIAIVATILKPGESPFRNVSSGGTTATYTTPTITEAMSGYRYRSIVKSNNGLPQASDIATLTVGKITPTASNLSYNISPVTYNGSPQSIRVVPKQGVVGLLGTITVKYNGSTTVPTKAGTYEITADVAGGTNSFAVPGIVLGEYKINPKPITIKDVLAPDKVYDGTTTIALTGGTLVGVASGNAVHFELGNGTVATPNVGSKKAVSTNITLIGADAGNYTLTQPTNVTVNIVSETPILPNRENPIIGRIEIQTIGDEILLSNLPQSAKIEVYSIQGKQIYSTNSENSNILRIVVQTKGMYIVKVGTQTIRAVVR